MSIDSFSNRFKHLKHFSKDFCALDQLYVYAHIRMEVGSDPIDLPPVKNDTMTIMLVKSGTLTFGVNMESYTIGPDNILVITPGMMVNLCNFDSDLELYMIAMSADFLHSVNINFTAISVPDFIEKQSPAIKLNGTESDLIMKYFDLLAINAKADVNLTIERNIASSLIASLVYQLVQFHYKHIGLESNTSGIRSSRRTYVHNFMKLIHVHYAQERSVKFYASKLCISPKYLSLLVKEFTGRSAVQWIDSLVLMEAKNMLRYSGKNIQQVAYALNFPNQSSFGKYFKHLTGQSPTEYQKQ